MRKKHILLIVIIAASIGISFLLGSLVEQRRDKFPITVDDQLERARLEISINDQVNINHNFEPIVRVGERVLLPSEDGHYTFDTNLKDQLSVYSDEIEFSLNLKDLPQQQCESSPPDNKNPENPESQKSGRYVGSKNSNKFHDPDCSWAQKIKDENKVWFKNAEEAKSKGYEPSSCATFD